MKDAYILLTLLLTLAIAGNAQGLAVGSAIEGSSTKQRQLDEEQVKRWTNDLTGSIFFEMNPKQTIRNHLFLGSLEKEEAKLFPREKWLNPFGKEMSNELLTKYFWLQFERAYFETFFSIGTKQFSAGFEEMLFDDNGFTTIENSDYESILASTLKRHRISKKDFVEFFREGKNTLSRERILAIERVLADLLLLVKSKISRPIYADNVDKIRKLWEIDQVAANRKYYLVSNPLLGRFVVGLKDGRVRIVYFPNSDD